jgi:hypothetical protein
MTDDPFLIAGELGDKGMQAEFFNPRLDGQARHVRVDPPFPAWQFALCCFVVAIVGFWIAVGHS